MLRCFLLVRLFLSGVPGADVFVFAAYLIIIVIRSYFWPLKGMTSPGEIRLVKFRSNFISTFPVQVFAFTCAQNVSLLFPIQHGLVLIFVAFPPL
jgi:amino acid permease